MMRKPQSHQMQLATVEQQKGSVLFMALIFLVLTALIAVTIMDTSILSRKMAGNSQFREEAMQIAEGVANETVYEVIDLLKGITAPQVGNVLCMKDSTDTDCTTKTLVLSDELIAAAGSADLNYKALFYSENPVSSSRSDEQNAGPTTDKFFDVVGTYDGVDLGLSQASLAIGVKARFTAGSSASQVSVEAAGSGTGTGNYMFNY